MSGITDALGSGAATITAIGLTATCVIFLLGRLVTGRPYSARGVKKGRNSRTESDPSVPGHVRERRCHYRRNGNPTLVAIGHPEESIELACGTIVDRSSGGVCLELFVPLAVGAVISMRPSAAAAMGSWIEAEVRHCRRSGAGWHIGFKFLRTPPLNVLWMFG